MQNPFLKLSSWWGLSNKPGKRQMAINEDGSFVKKLEYSLDKDKEDNAEEQGIIDRDRIAKLKTFLGENITEDSENQIFDAGNSIAYTRDSRLIIVKNNRNLWDQIMELVPEYNT